MTPTPADLERARALMMAGLDGELGPDEHRELEALVDRDPGLAEELARLKRVKEVTAMMALRNPSAEMWDGYWHGTYRNLERGVGWLLVAAGALVLTGWALWNIIGSLWADTETPVAIRVAVVAVLLGAIVLLFSVLREKLFTRRHDPYHREVVR